MDLKQLLEREAPHSVISVRLTFGQHALGLLQRQFQCLDACTAAAAAEYHQGARHTQQQQRAHVLDGLVRLVNGRLAALVRHRPVSPVQGVFRSWTSQDTHQILSEMNE